MVRLALSLGVCLMAVPRVASAQPAPPYTEEHVIILIDRSGSMVAPRLNGETRFQAALKRARDYVETVSTLPRHIAVWSFEGTSYIRHQAFSTSATTTLNTLNSLGVGQGVTPLAFSACAAVDELKSYRTTVLGRKKLRLSSDGLENSSPVGTQCQGGESVGGYPNLDPGSWQWKVLNKLRTGDATNPNPVPTFIQVIADIDFFTTYITDFNGSHSGAYEWSEKGEPTWSPVALPVEGPAVRYLGGLSSATGGRFSLALDNAPAPVFGDTNQDGCVNITDYDLVMANFGLTVPPGNRLADVNGDGLVDYSDYTVVVANWGLGGRCALPQPVRE
ncbi:hypothetical protein HUW62_33100 [Myxococcus sp. AM011]|nr:hypothetical protein [Myxococcus sp. AM011]